MKNFAKRFLSAAGLGAAALAAGLFASPPDAAAQPVCGQTYSVAPGDSLSLIAFLYSGDPSDWSQIYNFAANRAVIGPNPNLLVVGQRLQMPPCAGAAAAQAAAPTPSPQASVAATQRPLSPNRPSGGLIRIDVVTGDDFKPFVGRGLHADGMATEILEAAFASADVQYDVEITFINDWSSHLNTLVKYNKYQLAYPWYQPNCSRPDELPADMLIRCEYIFSDPIYVTAIKLYYPAGAESPPRAFDDLQGSTICRPLGWFTFDLAERGLYDGRNMTLYRPTTVDECFEALERGEVDYVSMTQFSAETSIAKLGLGPFIEEARGLVDALPLHVLAHSDNAEASYVWLEQLNIGLDRIKRSGEWDRIVNDHLDRFRASIGR